MFSLNLKAMERGKAAPTLGEGSMSLGTKFVCGVSALAILMAPAWAQDTAPPSDEDKPVEKVTVTAQKRSQVLIDVPLPVQSIGKQQIDNTGAGNVADLVTQIPGASIVSKSTPGFETVQIRGISSGTTGDGLVGYYVDETPFGIPNLQLSPPARLLDVTRVEVIRGPSGTLYGQGSMGGTIKVITATPDSTAFFGTIRGEISTTDGGGTNYYTDLVANLPIAENEFAVRLSGSFESLSGFAEAPEFSAKNVNEFTGANGRAVALWTPSDDLSITGMYWHIDNSQDFSNGLTPGFPTSSPTITGTGGVRGFTDVAMDLYSLTVNWDTSIGTLTSNTSFVQHELDFEAPFTLFGFPFNNDSTFETDSFTQEIRLASAGDGPFNWLVGGFYRDATIDSDICFYFQAFGCGIFDVVNIAGPLETKSWSIFGEASLAMFDNKLEALVGLRYFEDDRGGRTSNRTIFPAPPTLTDSTEGTSHALSPRFNLKYNVSEEGNVFVNVAKGFRSGALQTAAQAAASTTDGVPTSSQIDPDQLWTYELGTKWRLFDGTLFFEGSIYRTDWKDIQIQFTTTGGVIAVANAGDAQIEGIDLGLVWRTPIDGLTMQFVGSKLDTEFESVVPALSLLLPTIQTGQPLPNVPEMNYTISAAYSAPQAWLGGLNGSFYVGYAFRDDQFDGTTGLVSGKLNDLTLRAGLAGERWKLEAFMLNALDDDDPSVVNSISVQIIYPRRTGLMLTFDF